MTAQFTLPAAIAATFQNVTFDGTIEAFIQETKSNGARGLKIIAQAFALTEFDSNVSRVERLAKGLPGTDGRRVKALAVWYFGDALKVGKKGNWRFSASKSAESAAGRVRKLSAMAERIKAGDTFRGDSVAKMAGIATDEPAVFDVHKLALRVAKQLADNGESASAFAVMVAEAMKNVK